MLAGIVIILVLEWVFEWALFSRILDHPRVGLFASVAAAYLSGILIFVLLSPPGVWDATPIVSLLPGVVVALAWGLWKLHRRGRLSDDLS